MKDPHVDEVRKHRMEHTRRFNGDLHLICEDIRRFEATLKERIVERGPRRIQADRKSGASS
jgi:hypothetical protein